MREEIKYRAASADKIVSSVDLWPMTVEETIEATTRAIEMPLTVFVRPTNAGVRDLCQRVLNIERELHDAAEYRLEQSE